MILDPTNLIVYVPTPRGCGTLYPAFSTDILLDVDSDEGDWAGPEQLITSFDCPNPHFRPESEREAQEQADSIAADHGFAIDWVHAEDLGDYWSAPVLDMEDDLRENLAYLVGLLASR